MLLSKPQLPFRLKTLNLPKLLLLRNRLPPILIRHLSFVTSEEAITERRRRRRRLHIDPPFSVLRPNYNHPQHVASKPINPNAPKLPEPISALSPKRLNLHNDILKLISENDLNEASLLVRHSIYSNCRPTIFTINAVLNALLLKSRYSDLYSLHRFITQASIAPTIITHNLVLQAYCDCKKMDSALEHYRLIVKDDSALNPSPSTYRILTKGLVDGMKLEKAVELKDDMLDKGFVEADPVVYNLIMGGFLKNGEADRVLELYDELKEKLDCEVVENGIVHGNLMKAYFLKGMGSEAMSVYNDVMNGDKVRFNAVSFNLVLEALVRNEKLDVAIELFDRMCKEHNPPRKIMVNVGSYNVMVDGYCIAKRYDDAISVFRSMGEKKCIPDVFSYNNIIQQLGFNKLVEETEELYEEMSGRGISPDEYTYVLLAEACFGVGRVDDSVGYFNKMVEVGLKPSTSAYNKVIGGLVNAGKLDEAKEYFDLMVEKEVKPNLDTYEMFCRAFIEVGRLDDALKAVKGILLDENLRFSDEMKELVEEELRKEGIEEDMGRLYEAVEKEKAEALAREEAEKARIEALAIEEEERKKAEAAAKDAAAARASAAAIELMTGKRKLVDNMEEREKEEAKTDNVTSSCKESSVSDKGYKV